MIYAYMLIALSLAVHTSHAQTTHSYNQPHSKQYLLEQLMQNPSNSTIMNQLGSLYFNEHDYMRAAHYFGQCISRDPKNPDFIEQYAMTLDQLGQFTQARNLFEMLHDYDRTRIEPYKRLPQLYIRERDWYYVGKFAQADKVWWYDRDIENKSILLDLTSMKNNARDIILCMRYATHLAHAGAQVTIYTHPETRSIAQMSPDIDHVLTTNQEKPTTDLTYEMNTIRCIVCMREFMYEPYPQAPYLYADPELVDAWHEKIKNDANYKIGICVDMQSNPESVDLDTISALLENRTVSWYSLHADAHPTQNWNITHPNKIILHKQTSLIESAALIENLDLVITTDNAIAHLAGALGKPVWLLLPFVADCCWFEHHETTSVLYPSMQIFRQPKLGDWDTVIKTMQAELKEQCHC